MACVATRLGYIYLKFCDERQKEKLRSALDQNRPRYISQYPADAPGVARTTSGPNGTIYNRKVLVWILILYALCLGKREASLFIPGIYSTWEPIYTAKTMPMFAFTSEGLVVEAHLTANDADFLLLYVLEPHGACTIFGQIMCTF